MDGKTKGFFESNKKTPCQCEFNTDGGSFYCSRHKCDKSKHLHSLCKNSQRYFDLWEKNEGPLQDRLGMEDRVRPEQVVKRPTTDFIKVEKRTGFFDTKEEAKRETGFFDAEEYFMGDNEIPKESRGLGDTVAKFTKVTGIKKLVKKVRGGKCRCTERQAILNRLFPYGGKPKKIKGFFE